MSSDKSKHKKDKTSKDKKERRSSTSKDKRPKKTHTKTREKSKSKESSALFIRPDPHSNIEDHYQITDRILGKGFFAVVKFGINKKTKEHVAIKCIDKDKVEVQKLWNEIDILEKARHPRVVSLEAVFDTTETLYVVMELMEGGELYDEIVARKQFTERDCSIIIKQVFEALKYSHSISIIHRDLKLENLLIKDKAKTNLQIKLADFGLSKISKQTFSACGTPFYVAPDILLAGNTGDGYTTQVDMWACGILMYTLLSGRLPFHAQDDIELFKMIMKGSFVFKSPQFDTVSITAKDLINKLLVVDPTKRFTAAQALEHPFISGEVKDTPLHDSFIRELSNSKLLSRSKLFKTS